MTRCSFFLMFLVCLIAVSPARSTDLPMQVFEAEIVAVHGDTGVVRMKEPGGAFLLSTLTAGGVVAVRGDTVFVRGKSQRGALMLALIPTVAGGLLMTSFANGGPESQVLPALMLILVGPAPGLFYANDTRRAWLGIAARGAGALVTTMGFGLAFGGEQSGAIVFVAAATAVLLSTFDDLKATRVAVRHYNERHAVRVSLAPVVGAQRGVRLAVRM